MDERRRWCVARISRPDGTVLAEWALSGPGRADLRAVNAIARLALLARRAGGVLTVADESGELGGLLELCGLEIQVQRQAEGREQPRRVQRGQEEVHRGNLSG
jgi:hypothetical protein